LARGLINQSGQLSVELIEPADMPAVVRIVWLSATTITTPTRYTEVAAAAMKVLANAVTRYNQLRRLGSH
jgi:hypothetical protein